MMDPSAAFNQFYGHFMAELGLAFPGDPGVEEVQRRFASAVEQDPQGPSRALPKQIEPCMEMLMAHDAKKATVGETNGLIATIAERVELLHGLRLPVDAEGEDGQRLTDNKNAVLDYMRNLGLMSIGLANMPPGMMQMIASLAGDASDDDEGGAGATADLLGSLGPMLGPLLGSGFNFGV